MTPTKEQITKIAQRLFRVRDEIFTVEQFEKILTEELAALRGSLVQPQIEKAQDIARKYVGGLSVDDITARRALCAEAIATALAEASAGAGSDMCRALFAIKNSQESDLGMFAKFCVEAATRALAEASCPTEAEAAAFHRGVDAAKEAIRGEADSHNSLSAAWDASDAEFDAAVAAKEIDETAHFYAATFINAIARKCGFDREAEIKCPKCGRSATPLSLGKICGARCDNLVTEEFEPCEGIISAFPAPSQSIEMCAECGHPLDRSPSRYCYICFQVERERHVSRLTPEVEAEIAEIEKRANAATDGKWTWNINLHAKQIRLESDGPRQIVIDFARWGSGGAKPRFILNGRMEGSEMFAQTVEGREHHSSWYQTIRHPDADFIAHAREDVARLISLLRQHTKEL